MNVLTKDNLSINFKIIVKNNKHTYIRVKKDGIYVTTNKNLSETKIKEYLLKNFDHYYKKNEELQKSFSVDKITLEDINYNINWIDNSNFKYELIDNQCYIYSKSKNKKYVLLVFENYLKNKMLNNVYPEILNIMKKDNVFERPLKFKYLKSKFGSYHKVKNYIVINTYLAQLNINYLKYVIFHEYAHTIHFNHSKKFYSLISKWMPDYKKYHKNLKKQTIID